ncbi:LamG-like jellyroll fold domain-containing protein [Haloferula sp. A504]|uniref:LamG-like jellyroll fold domain-containing protein n=1 Tax=Haloferula sp. A504 TaxID=3373601 RepID=UPI0031C8E2B6|nr:LamG domain-containing protein [Verrucomicrobiaceae bacterium E54]
MNQSRFFKTLAVFWPFALPVAADTLLPADLGSSGVLPQVIRHETLRIYAPGGGNLYRGNLSGVPSLGVTGGLDDRTVSGAEVLTISFDRKSRIDSLEISDFGVSDSPFLVSGFPADPGASLSNGSASFANGTLSLTATSFASSATVSFSSPQACDMIALSAPNPSAGANGVALARLDHTPQPQVLYREEFPNGMRSARPLEDCGWDGAAAINTNSGATISPTQTVVSASTLGSGDLGASVAAGGLTFTSNSGNLFVGSEGGILSLGTLGSFKDTTLSQGENFEVTAADSLVVDAVTISGFGPSDSPVVLGGFPADPGASLDNGTAAFSGDSVTLTSTSFSSLASVTFANSVVVSALNVRCDTANGGAGGVGIPSITYRAASASGASTAHIAGVFGDDYVEVFAAQGEGNGKAVVSTEEDFIDHDPASYTGLELRWEQAGGANGANTAVRPMVEVGGQWFASATAFPVAGDSSPFATETISFNPAASSWLAVALGENSATLGAAPASDLSGPITNLGFFIDFSADDEDQTVLLDRLELAGHPLDPDSEPWTFVSAPDFTNADIADMSGAITGVPASSGWDGGQNGTTAEIEDSFLAFFQSMTSEAPDLFLVAGDLVEGEWFKDAAGRQVIGPVDTDANREIAFIEGSYYYYGHYQNAWFQANGLRVIACVGDHELGDNDWPLNGVNTKLIPTMRNEFSRWFTRFPIGQWSTYTPLGRPDRTSPDFGDTPAPLIYPDRPVGSPHEQTAFAVRHKDTLIISMDVFQHTDPSTELYPYGITVKPELEAGQLAWVQSLLAEAEADPGIRHIVTQCHPPILQPVLTTASSGMTYANGESSALFQAMAAHGVDLHFSGEVHDIAASRHMGVQQIVHGSPPGSRVLNHLVVRVHPDKLDCTIKTGRQHRDTSIPYWQPQSGDNRAGFAEMRESFKPAGAIVIDKSGPEDVISEGTGFLANIEHDDYLLHYSFDHPSGTRQMSNEGSLPDVNADGQRKWRGDLDAAWLSPQDFVAGKFGNSLRFAGVTGDPDEIYAGECPTPINKPRTMAFWIKTSQSGFMNIAGFGDIERFYGEFGAQVASDGRLQLDIGAYTAVALGAPVINDGNWHHCAIVVPAWDQSTLGEVLFQVDGVAYPAETSNPDINIFTKTTSSKGKLRIGRHTLNNDSPFVGELDDFVIWGRALSTAEISLLHAFGSSSLAYDVAKADPLLKAFRRGEGVEIDGTTWFYVGADLRGAPGTAYDLDGDFLTPLAAGAGMTTQPDAFQRSLRADIPTMNTVGKQVTLTWNSLPGASYLIEGSDDFSGWDPEPGGESVPSQGASTTHVLTYDSLPGRRFYRLTETP